MSISQILLASEWSEEDILVISDSVDLETVQVSLFLSNLLVTLVQRLDQLGSAVSKNPFFPDFL